MELPPCPPLHLQPPEDVLDFLRLNPQLGGISLSSESGWRRTWRTLIPVVGGSGLGDGPSLTLLFGTDSFNI